MTGPDVLPELKQILGAMIFGAARALSVREMRRCLKGVAETEGGETAAFGEVKEGEIRAALDALRSDLESCRCGHGLVELAGGYRLQSDPGCGKWLRHLLNAGRPSRLSQPALETLAVIAYRQPVSRADIEVVRGVAVDHVIKTLLEMQLVRIAGRSELPGRPFLYGTTHLFLEHFGLKSLEDLGEIDPFLVRREAPAKRTAPAEAAAAEAGPAGTGGDADETDQPDEPDEAEEAEEAPKAVGGAGSEDGGEALDDAGDAEYDDEDDDDAFDDEEDD